MLHLDAVLSGDLPGILASAHLVPDPLPAGLTATVVGAGDRRQVLTGGGALGDLPPGTPVSVPDARYGALLRAYHPRLVPVEGDAPASHGIVPLWIDPGAETRGELLERDSWLPGPGEGITVLIRREGVPAGEPEDTAGRAVLAAERGVADAFPGSLLSVRGQSFGGGIRLQALLVSPDGRQAVRGEAQGPLDRPAEVATRLVHVLERRGARLIAAPDPR